jgi:hypothetical protein
VLVYFARNGELPMSPFGWRYMAGPVEQLGPLPFMALGWTLVAVSALDVVAGRWLWQGRDVACSWALRRTPAPLRSVSGSAPLLIVGVRSGSVGREAAAVSTDDESLATTAVVLILGFAASLHALMYWLRGGIRGSASEAGDTSSGSATIIMTAVVLTAVGPCCFRGPAGGSTGRLSASGAVAYLFGGVLVVAAEASSLAGSARVGRRSPGRSQWSTSCWRCWRRRGGALLAGDVRLRGSAGPHGLEHRMAGVLPAAERRHLHPSCTTSCP